MNKIKRLWIALAAVLGIGLAVVIARNALADVPQPVLTIAPLGSNQFSITITNGVSTTNYTLFWTPFLADENYPWEVLGVGDTGETNFMIDAGGWASGFFRVLVGADRDGDGWPDWQDADPLDPNVGQLQVIIYSPAHGSTINN